MRSLSLIRVLRFTGICIAWILTACTQQTEPPIITTVGGRADLISGGDALVEIQLPAKAKYKNLKVELAGADITSQFKMMDDGKVLGVVNNLVNGENQLIAQVGQGAAQLTITNHPIGGPMFSGKQIQPWVCAAPQAKEGDADHPALIASGLSTEAVDEQCNIAAEVKYYYRTTNHCGRDPDNPRRPIPCFKSYDVNAPAPADLAQTTTYLGETIPYIVRVERGTINRGIYDIAVLDIPSKEKPGTDWSPLQKSKTWNGKLVHVFGGGSGTPFRQMPPNSRWTYEAGLSRGYMVSVNSLTDQALNANHVVAAETVMMMKDYISDHFGKVTMLLGSGCSGGSIMQNMIAGMYPGLLDGIQPSCTYPDSYSTGIEVSECVYLENYFDSDVFKQLTAGLSEEQVAQKKADIAGHLDDEACVAWKNSFGGANEPGNFINPRGNSTNNCRLPANWVFDPEKNPTGVRCSQPDHAVAQWGLTPGKHYGRRIMDNVGVQYGLKALNEGKISAEEFVALNENIGASDLDKGLIKERIATDEESLKLAYRMGMIADPRQWVLTPSIDLRGSNNSGIHMNWRTFAVRDRLDSVVGHHRSQIIWRFGPGLLPPEESGLTSLSLETLDAWVTALRADTTDAPWSEKLEKDKPAAAYDFCLIGDDYQTKVTDKAKCDADPVLAYYSSPRQVAGGPLAENIMKCQLKALDKADYSVEFTDEQWQRLQATFTDGVCDWSKPGVGTQPAVPWLDYSNGPGGEQMPPHPVSVPL